MAGDGMVRGEAKPVLSPHLADTLAAAGSYGLRDLWCFRQWWATATGSAVSVVLEGQQWVAVGSSGFCQFRQQQHFKNSTPVVSAASALLGLVTPFHLIGQA